MAGSLGSHSLGGFQVSGRAAGGAVTTASASSREAPSTAGATGGEVTTASGSAADAPGTTSTTGGGMVTTASASDLQALSTRGRLGYWELGTTYLSNQVVGEASTTTASTGPLTATGTARAIAGEVTTASVSSEEAPSTARSSGGELTTVSAAPFGRMARDFRLGDAGLGDEELGEGLPLTIASAGEIEAASASPADAERWLDYWAFDGLQVDGLTDESRKHNSITLTFRVKKDLANRALRPLNKNPEKFDILQYPDGTFEAVDRVDGSNTFQVRAPSARQDVRYIDTWHVKKYSEETVDQKADKLRVQVTLIPATNKETQASYDTKEKSQGDWRFVFSNGDIVTRRVQADLSKKSGSPTGDVLTAVLTEEEVKVLEENTGKQDAVRLREVPDGEDVPEDNTPNSDQTITIEPANMEPVEPGKYIVEDWETRYVNDDFYRVQLTVTQTEETELSGFGDTSFGRYFGR